MVTPPFKLWPLLGRINYIGFRSLLIILLTGAFTGMVLGLQIFFTSPRSARGVPGSGGRALAHPRAGARCWPRSW
jgi:phospholipid/cholesterol/gamma-HCH transport system permease protein